MRHIAILFGFIIVLTCHHSKNQKSSFEFINNDQGIELQENGQKVFSYQKEPKSSDGKYICNNYIHPLYNLKGDTLTEEFPSDHPYHRGIFWAWHQIYVNGKSVGDGWVMDDITQKISDVQTTATVKNAQLKLKILWKSAKFDNGKPFIEEHTSITVHAFEDSVRKIDFVISLRALVPEVEIGGANDEKGYGRFCARLKLPKDLAFTSDSGTVFAKLTQINAGPWMDFSASFGEYQGRSGITIFCHPETPNYPEPWILRSETSMQNVVFPGRSRVEIPMDKPVNLYYRLIIHQGDADKIDLNKFQKEYEGSIVVSQAIE